MSIISMFTCPYCEDQFLLIVHQGGLTIYVCQGCGYTERAIPQQAEVY